MCVCVCVYIYTYISVYTHTHTHIFIHSSVESKIWHKWTYLQNRNRLTDIENRLVAAKGKGEGEGMNWEFGINICKLLYLKWINYKVLLFSSGNYIQYPVINHNGKEYEKEYIYVCIYIYIYICIYIKLNHFIMQ